MGEKGEEFMDAETKQFLGFILGQVYRIQQKMGSDLCHASDATIFGLLNGFGGVIDEQLEGMGNISSEDVDRLGAILDEYLVHPTKAYLVS